MMTEHATSNALAGMSRHQREHWAWDKLQEIKAKHVAALRINGWKIRPDLFRYGVKRKLQKLAALPLEEQWEWASDVMWDITDEHVIALDIEGRRIISVDGFLWSFASKSAGYPCPEWCEDL